MWLPAFIAFRGGDENYAVALDEQLPQIAGHASLVLNLGSSLAALPSGGCRILWIELPGGH